MTATLCTGQPVHGISFCQLSKMTDVCPSAVGAAAATRHQSRIKFATPHLALEMHGAIPVYSSD